MRHDNRILVIDDNLNIHEDFRKILSPLAPRDLDALEANIFGEEAQSRIRDLTYQLSFASNSQDALQQFTDAQKNGDPFSVVFSDVRLPEAEDGIALVEQIWHAAADTQIVIMTAFADYSWEELIERFGWSDRLLILRKPFDPITIKQLALMLSQRYHTEETLLQQRDDLASLVAQKEAAETNLARFREALDQANDAVFMLDPHDGSLRDFNQTAARMLGYPSYRLESMTMPELLVSGDYHHWKDSQMFEEELRCMDGSTIAVEVSCSKKELGGEECLVAVARDIRDRKSLQHEREQMEAQLRHAQKMQTLGTLASGIAHDFNNILSPILVYTEMAIDDVTSEKVREDLQQVAQATYRARDLVQHLLNFSSSVEKERMPLKIQLVVKEALHLIRASTPSSIHIRQELSSTGPVLAGPTQIHQILMNLCANAQQAMQENGGTMTVKLHQHTLDQATANRLDIAAGDYCCLQVSDTGIGMTESVQAKIFEPFFSTRKETKGTGLGLSIVQDIVSNHDGAIDLESKVGVGTTFRVYFPLSTESATEESTPQTEPKSGREHILFVDDEEMIARMMSELLTRYGYEVTSLIDSGEALELFKASPHKYDLLITDQTMPSLLGTELAQEALKIRPDLPVILCTGFAESVNEETCRKIGIRDYMLKPIVGRDLVANIKDLLSEKSPTV